MSGEINVYKAPRWAENLSDIPTHYVSLANRPTITHTINFQNRKIWITRDDLTGSELSGNKVRKLEFILADCLQNSNQKKVITAGGVQSNHCRATVVACRRLGLEPHIVLATVTEPNNIPIQGNIIFDRFFGAQIHTIPQGETRSNEFNHLALQLNAYPIPVGGSNRIGSWGYLQKWDELTSQGVLQTKKSIFLALGSGGTAAGVILGNYLTGNKHKIYLIQVAHTIKIMDEDIRDIIKQFKNNGVALNIEEVMEKVEYVSAIGHGYAISDQSELEYIQKFAIQVGIFLDRVYSGKAFKKMMEIIENDSNIHDVLFIHTGGIHSISDAPIVNYLKNQTASCVET